MADLRKTFKVWNKNETIKKTIKAEKSINDIIASGKFSKIGVRRTFISR